MQLWFISFISFYLFIYLMNTVRLVVISFIDLPLVTSQHCIMQRLQSRFTSRNTRLLRRDVDGPSLPSPYMVGKDSAFRNEVMVTQVCEIKTGKTKEKTNK